MRSRPATFSVVLGTHPKAFMGAKAKRSAQETAQLEEGEYLDESPSVFLSEPLWSAERTRRFQGQDGTIVDEIMELEVSKETYREETNLYKGRCTNL